MHTEPSSSSFLNPSLDWDHSVDVEAGSHCRFLTFTEMWLRHFINYAEGYMVCRGEWE